MTKVVSMPVEGMDKLLDVLGEIMEKQSMEIKPISKNMIELSA